MQWISALSDSPEVSRALDETIASVKRDLRGERPDLLLVFVSSEFLSGYETIVNRLQAEVGPRVLLGCSGGGVVGNGREIEHRPALVLTAALLPDVAVTPIRIADGALPGLDVSPRQWHSLAGVSPQQQPHFIL